MTEVQNQIQEAQATGMTYDEFRALVSELLADGKSTGPKQSEALTHYSELNEQRMNRIDKTFKWLPELEDYLKQLDQNYKWLVITEGWCGDSAQNLPVLGKIAEASDKIEMRIILRDDNLDIMDQYLTNGGRGIPKLVVFNADTGEELGTWGPRPKPVQQMVMDWKQKQDKSYDELSKETQLWYARDKAQTMQQELLNLFKEW